MRNLLIAVFSIILIWMVGVTVNAQIEQSIWDTWPTYSANPWAIATLWDAYFGFTIFWIWVAVRETNWGTRLVWLILIYGLGNMATALYALIQVARLGQDDPVSSILLPKGHNGNRGKLVAI